MLLGLAHFCNGRYDLQSYIRKTLLTDLLRVQEGSGILPLLQLQHEPIVRKALQHYN